MAGASVVINLNHSFALKEYEAGFTDKLLIDSYKSNPSQSSSWPSACISYFSSYFAVFGTLLDLSDTHKHTCRAER